MVVSQYKIYSIRESGQDNIIYLSKKRGILCERMLYLERICQGYNISIGLNQNFFLAAKKDFQVSSMECDRKLLTVMKCSEKP